MKFLRIWFFILIFIQLSKASGQELSRFMLVYMKILYINRISLFQYVYNIIITKTQLKFNLVREYSLKSVGKEQFISALQLVVWQLTALGPIHSCAGKFHIRLVSGNGKLIRNVPSCRLHLTGTSNSTKPLRDEHNFLECF